MIGTEATTLVVRPTFKCALVDKNVLEWADICWEIFALKSNTIDEVLRVIVLGGFRKHSFGLKLYLFFQGIDLI